MVLWYICCAQELAVQCVHMYSTVLLRTEFVKGGRFMHTADNIYM